jgi:hypothetical protein
MTIFLQAIKRADSMTYQVINKPICLLDKKRWHRTTESQPAIGIAAIHGERP